MLKQIIPLLRILYFVHVVLIVFDKPITTRHIEIYRLVKIRLETNMHDLRTLYWQRAE